VQQLQRRARADQRFLVVGGRVHGPVAPVAERRAEPLAAGDGRVRLAHQAVGVGAERRERGGLLVDEGVEDGLDAVAETGAVPAVLARHGVETSQWTPARSARPRT